MMTVIATIHSSNCLDIYKNANSFVGINKMLAKQECTKYFENSARLILSVLSVDTQKESVEINRVCQIKQ